ncbi:MAG: PEPxxWA-CTERM sorting domain-containing protein [Sphingomonas phyllosphaerae]|uniref:PEPxxWA-CTERM sorting domain-containing protein n=1 Tax=Sphingomonas phyllosphaerae TaxID=257003 RepID=UPI002FF57306
MKTGFRVALAALAVTAAAPSYAATVVSTSSVDYSADLLLGAQAVDNAATRDQNATLKNANGSFSGQGSSGTAVSGTVKGGNVATATGSGQTIVTTTSADSWVARFTDDLSAASSSAAASASLSISHAAVTTFLLNQTGLLNIGYIAAATDIDTRAGNLAGRALDYINIYQGANDALLFSGTLADYTAASTASKTFQANTSYKVSVNTLPRTGFDQADAQVIGAGTQAYKYDRSISFSLNGVTGAVPEPATWAMMILGFGLVGAALRQRRSAQIKLPA